MLRPGLVRPAADPLTRPAADRLVRPAAATRLAAATTPHVATDGPQACAAASDAAASQGGYTTDQIASAYRFSGVYDAGAQGQGVTIALYELEPDDPTDIAAYQACYKTSASVSYVRVDGGAGAGDGDGEAALDVENAIGLAPRASFLVYQGPNSGQGAPGSGPYDLLRQIVTDDRAQVISVSWGSCEQLVGAGNLRATSALFEEAAAQGQSIVSATGDQGSEDCNQDNGLPNGSLAVDDPGSQPFVTAVGGTTLRSLGPPPKERVWNNGGDPASPRGGAGGGGLSQMWAMPSYQSGAAASLRVIRQRSSGSACGNPSGHPRGDSGSNPNGFCRAVPDVAADADPSTGYMIYWNGSGAAGPSQPSGWQEVAGTSGAAPLWAALLADADSSSACHGTRIGFANPALYRAASGSYGSYFNDITSGSNDFTGTNGGRYGAGAGYDLASGLGSPKADALAARLCSGALQVDDPGLQVSTVGRPLGVQVATNAPAGARLRFTARNLPAGLSISRSTGRISGRPRRTGSTLVIVTVTGRGLVLRSAAFIWKVVGPRRHVVGPRRRPRGRRELARVRAGARRRHLVGFGA
jgi:subtilase family serine protease